MNGKTTRSNTLERDGNEAIARVLVERGANRDATDKEGYKSVQKRVMADMWGDQKPSSWPDSEN